VLAAQAGELGPGTALLYVELLETRRAYLGNLTPLPALPASLLTALRVDADAAVQRFLVDGWLLLRVRGGAGPQARAPACTVLPVLQTCFDSAGLAPVRLCQSASIRPAAPFFGLACA
jgi:hypothetical protein